MTISKTNIMTTYKLKDGDFLNIIGSDIHLVMRVTEKAVLIDWGTNNEYERCSKWIPKSVLNILNVDHLTSETGTVYRVAELPYFLLK